jgi:hypothetical protein
MHARIENVFRVTEATFWDVLFFDYEYNSRLHKELGFQTYEVRAIEDRGEGKVFRALRCEPPLKVPEMLRKRIQSRVFYEEEGVYDRQARRWTFSSTSTVMPDSAKIGGIITTQPHPEGTLHIVELDVRITALGLGGMIERIIEKNVRESYAVTTRFTNAFATEKGLTLRAVSG